MEDVFERAEIIKRYVVLLKQALETEEELEASLERVRKLKAKISKALRELT